MCKLYLAFILTLIISFSQAQPHLQGTLKVDINKGYFDGQFTLSNLPELSEYKILLNKGMNIKYFKNKKGKLLTYEGFYSGKMRGEAIEYAVQGATLPKSFSVEYVGAFPRYEDDFNEFDFKGFIAINDKTLRATEQTKWYPVIYDAANDRLINSYTYDLTIQIEGGSTIFINGSAPQKAKSGTFQSSKPYPLLLFLGDYDFVENDGNYILNDKILVEEATKVYQNIDLIKKSLKNTLQQEFEDKIYLIKHEAVNKRSPGSSWGFNTYPSFAFTGIKFGNLVKQDGKFSNDKYRYFGHEFAHNYFGNNVQSGKLYWFWLESFPEYLSFRIAEEFSGEAYLKKVLLKKVKNLQEQNFVSLSKIEKANQIDEAYRYNLAPLLLQCMEGEFGKEVMDTIMRQLLKKAKTETLSLKILESIAIEIGVKSADYQSFADEFVYAEKFKENILNYITSKYQ